MTSPDMALLDYGPRPKLDWLHVDNLLVDQRYQREQTSASRSQIKKITSAFSWEKFGALVVCGPDFNDDYAVIDGQHRLEAARAACIALVPCVIIAPAAIAVQADAFVGINRDRQRMHTIALYHAALAANVEPDCQIAALLAEVGLEVPRLPINPLPPGKILCIGNLKKMFRTVGPDILRDGLRVCQEAYAEEEDALRGTIVQGVVRIVGLYRAELDVPRLVRTLASLPPDKIIRDARTLSHSFGGSVVTAAADVIRRAYNKGARADQRIGAAE